jgi:hypothetical protein
MTDELACIGSFVNIEVLGVGKEERCGLRSRIGAIDKCMVQVEENKCFQEVRVLSL